MSDALEAKQADRALSPTAGALAPTTTEHAAETYLPEARQERRGIALCLSGGGYRAALLHLGALRRLNELGILSQVDTISAVSGGSILAAFLADRLRPWPAPGSVVPNWEAHVAAPFRRFTSRNIRTAPLLRRLLPQNWFRSSTAVEALAQVYEAKLTALRLTDLPAHPRIIFCATDLTFGVNWESEQAHIGDYEAGYVSPAPDWPVGRAVAASSCFPPIFDPLPIDLRADQLKGGAQRKNSQRDALIAGLRLSDGGVYDNMGLEPVWQQAAHILVSDGGAVFAFSADKGPLWRLNRYTSVVSNQARSLRKRWLISNFVLQELHGTYWGLGSAAAHYKEHDDDRDPPGYSEQLVDEVIVPIRTDLDSFSAGEQAVLENHGYLLASAAIQQHEAGLIQGAAPPATPPHRHWMNEAKVRRELRHSSEIKLLGR